MVARRISGSSSEPVSRPTMRASMRRASGTFCRRSARMTRAASKSRSRKARSEKIQYAEIHGRGSQTMVAATSAAAMPTANTQQKTPAVRKRNRGARSFAHVNLIGGELNAGRRGGFYRPHRFFRQHGCADRKQAHAAILVNRFAHHLITAADANHGCAGAVLEEHPLLETRLPKPF